MKFLSFKSKQPATREVVTSMSEVIDADTTELLPAQQTFPVNPFFSFTYYSQEMRISNGMTHLNFSKVRFEDGQLKSEKIECQFPADVYTQTVRNTQRLIADQTLAMMKQVTSLMAFPFLGSNTKE